MAGKKVHRITVDLPKNLNERDDAMIEEMGISKRQAVIDALGRLIFHYDKIKKGYRAVYEPPDDSKPSIEILDPKYDGFSIN